MPRLLRKKFVCFYCGEKSVQDRVPGIRQWQCEKCEASNYLDENGDITDPPALETSDEARYAQAIPRSKSLGLASPDEYLFCSTCLQNQKFLTETLASYFPPPDASNYGEYEKNYPKFRKSLEERYPQVCHQCEPRVRAKIRDTGYAAKTDHLRRMMERSRDTERYRGGWSWKRLAISTGAAGWFVSQVGQLLWNSQGAFAASQDGLRLEEFEYSSLNCLWWVWSQPHDIAPCKEVYNFYAGIALGLGLCFCWWNPGLKARFQKDGRILGLQQYYSLQIIFLVIRTASWKILCRSQIYGFDARTIKAIHSLMLVFTVLSIIISLQTVHLDSKPKVIFQESLGPLIHDSAIYSPLGQPNQPISQPHGKSTRLEAQRRPFSLDDLAPATLQSDPLLQNPPTPPPDEGEPDAMDWTPSQKPLPPATRRVTNFGHSQPSPFYGRLPPAPVSQAHKLRNPPNQPTFRKASTPQKQTVFKRPSSYLDQDDISEAGSEITATTIDPSEYASPGFAPPKFFPNSDYLKDTGLESIFSKTFSIAEEPHEVRVARELQHPSTLHQNPQNGRTRAFFSVVLALSCSVWSYSFIIPDVPIRFRYACLIIAVIVAAYGVIQSIKKPKKDIIWSYVSVYGFELCAAIFLFGAISARSTGVIMSGPGAQGFALFGFMALQELYILYIGSRSTQVRSTGKAPSTQESAPSPPNQDESTRNGEISSSSSRTTIPQRTPVPSSERTTRSQSRLEKRAGVSPGLNNLSLGDGGLSGTQYPRTKRKW